MTEQQPGTLVDSNVLLDLFTEDPTWSAWSSDRLAEALDRGPVLINLLTRDATRYRTHFPTIELIAPD